MKDIQLYNFKSEVVGDFNFPTTVDHPIRVMMRDGEPWFIANDICRALDIENSRQVLRSLATDEKGVYKIYTPGGEQSMGIVSESGLYTIILRSHDAIKPGTVAFKFRRWVTKEVLPTIRKTGRYARKEAKQTTPRLTASLVAETRLLLKFALDQMPRLDDALKQEMFRNATTRLYGEPLLPAAQIAKTWTMAEIAQEIGLKPTQAAYLGRIANEANLRTSEHHRTYPLQLDDGRWTDQDRWTASGRRAVIAAYEAHIAAKTQRRQRAKSIN